MTTTRSILVVLALAAFAWGIALVVPRPLSPRPARTSRSIRPAPTLPRSRRT